MYILGILIVFMYNYALFCVYFVYLFIRRYGMYNYAEIMYKVCIFLNIMNKYTTKPNNLTLLKYQKC